MSEAMEKKTFDRFRALGCTKGEAMKAANKLGNTMEASKKQFINKFERENGFKPVDM